MNSTEKSQETGEGQEFFIDPHVHSTYSSDGVPTVRELFLRARQIGLHGFGIMDHNDIRSAKEGLELAKEFTDILFIPGVEVTTDKGHILALNVTELIPRGKPIPETIELIHDQGGLAVADHPYRGWSGIGEQAVLDNLEGFDAIESFNARNILNQNRKAKALVQRTGKPDLGGSDCHIAAELGGGYTVLETRPATVEDFLEEIRQGRTRAGTGQFVKVGPGKILRQGAHCVASWLKRGMKDI